MPAYSTYQMVAPVAPHTVNRKNTGSGSTAWEVTLLRNSNGNAIKCYVAALGQQKSDGSGIVTQADNTGAEGSTCLWIAGQSVGIEGEAYTQLSIVRDSAETEDGLVEIREL